MSTLLVRTIYAALFITGVVVLYESMMSAEGAVARDGLELAYAYDEDLGWAPSEYAEKHAGDEGAAALPYRLMIMGGAADNEADSAAGFPARLDAAQPEWDVIDARVDGYGTDQSLLLARRLVPEFGPTAIALVFDPKRDRAANRTNRTVEGPYKPYFAEREDKLVLKGHPVPRSAAYREDGIPDLHLARLLSDASTGLLHPTVVVPDPTVAVLRRFREEVGRVGVSFLVGLTHPDREVEAALDAARVPWVHLFDGLDGDAEGPSEARPAEEQALVAERLSALLAMHFPFWQEPERG